MKLSDLGEKSTLEILRSFLDQHELYIDDDAVAYKLDEKYLIVNVDTLVGSTDILPGTRPEDIGFKTVTMTVSDIVAKGGKPLFFLVSINTARDSQIGFLEEIERGIKKACVYYGLKFFGGDLNESNDLVITGVSLGYNTAIVSRKGAKPGDTVWTTGEFGFNGVTFHYLLKNGEPIRGIEKILEYTIRKGLTVRDGSFLSRIATSSMDSSDGLALTLNTIAEINNVKISLDDLPIPQEVHEYAKINDLDALELALYAGEEFEIVFTTDKSDEEVTEIFKKFSGKPPYKIGYVTEGHGVYYKGEKIESRGWEHFT